MVGTRLVAAVEGAGVGMSVGIALARPGMSVGKLEAILARQLPQEEKKKRADYVIDTDEPMETVREKVAALVAKLKTEAP